jgi:hypothetical protein
MNIFRLLSQYDRGAITEIELIGQIVQNANDIHMIEIPPQYMREVRRAVIQAPHVRVVGMEIDSEKETKLYREGAQIWRERFRIKDEKANKDSV